MGFAPLNSSYELRTKRAKITAKVKGNVLEDLVVMMHEVPGVFVEK